MAHVPGYTFLRLDDATVDATAFGRRADRAGGAIGTSIAMHALLLLAAWGVTRIPPAASGVREASASSPLRFVYSALGGPESGRRSGGGNQSRDSAGRVQTVGRDAIAAAAVPRMPLTPPPAIPPESLQTLVPSLTPMDAGRLLQLGTVDGPSAPPDARGPGVAGQAGEGTRGGLGDDDGPGTGRGKIGDGVDDGEVYGIGNGVSAPAILYQTRPQYTSDAMRAKIQGVALLSAVVAPDGTLRAIRVARSLDGTFGLDREAIACVRQWKFRPGMRMGKPVAVAVTIEVAFNLR